MLDGAIEVFLIIVSLSQCDIFLPIKNYFKGVRIESLFKYGVFYACEHVYKYTEGHPSTVEL